MQRVDGAAECHHGIGIGDVAAGVAAMQRRLVGMLEIKVGRDGDEAVAREPLRQVADVADQAVALVHDDHRGCPCRGVRHRDKRRHAAGAGNHARGNPGHCFDACARKLASMKPVSGGGSARSPMATSASKLALMPSSNNPAARAITCCLT